MAFKFFRFPWAENGDKAVIPETTQANGEVSYQEGFGEDYDKNRVATPLTPADPGAKSIERNDFNGAMGDVTGNIKHWQENAYPDWTPATPGGAVGIVTYPFGARVRFNNRIYECNATAGTTNNPLQAGWIDVTFARDYITVSSSGTALAISSTSIPLNTPLYLKTINALRANSTITVTQPDGTNETFQNPFRLNDDSVYSIVKTASNAYTITPFDTNAQLPVLIWSGSAGIVTMSSVTAQLGFELIPGRYIIEYEVFSTFTANAEIIISEQPTQANAIYEVFTILDPGVNDGKYSLEVTKAAGQALGNTQIRANVSGNFTISDVLRILYQPF